MRCASRGVRDGRTRTRGTQGSTQSTTDTSGKHVRSHILVEWELEQPHDGCPCTRRTIMHQPGMSQRCHVGLSQQWAHLWAHDLGQTGGSCRMHIRLGDACEVGIYCCTCHKLQCCKLHARHVHTEAPAGSRGGAHCIRRWVLGSKPSDGAAVRLCEDEILSGRGLPGGRWTTATGWATGLLMPRRGTWCASQSSAGAWHMAGESFTCAFTWSSQPWHRHPFLSMAATAPSTHPRTAV